MDALITNLIPLLVIFTSVGAASFFFVDTIQGIGDRMVLRGSQSAKIELERIEQEATARTFYLKRAISSFAVLCLGTYAINIAFGLVLSWIVYMIPGVLLKRKIEARERLISEQFVGGLEMLRNALKSGLTLQQAIELLVRESPAPLSTEFSRVIGDTRLGVEIRAAIENMSARLKLPVFTIFSTGVAVTIRYGGDLGEVFQHIAETIRSRASIEGKIDAVTSLGRYQALVLSGMPFVLLVMLYFIDRQHVELLFTTKIGLFAVGGMVTLVVIANAWIARLMKVDV
jgi:tight adherence protein B